MLSATDAIMLSEADNRRKFQAIMSWDMSRIEKYLVNHHQMDSNLVQKLVLEYRRFMILTVLHSNLKIPIAGRVDEVWHTHIMFTQDYIRFGSNLVGGYIHHTPTVSQEEADELFGEYRDNTIELYRKFFGNMDPELWGERAQVCSCNGSWGKHHPDDRSLNFGRPVIPV